MSASYPNRVSELPNQGFFAILTTTGVYTPGDERSRTNPGHGYPASTDYYWTMQVFQNRKAWEDEVKVLAERKSEFKAVFIEPANIQTSISIDVGLRRDGGPSQLELAGH